MMKKHGLRRCFSLLLAVIMVCALLPTAALAEDTTGDGETQPKTVVVDEDGKTQKKEDTPPQNPEQGTPPADGDDGDKGSDSPALTSERGSRPVTITVRVFSSSTGASAVVGSDTAGAGNPGRFRVLTTRFPHLQTLLIPASLAASLRLPETGTSPLAISSPEQPYSGLPIPALVR